MYQRRMRTLLTVAAAAGIAALPLPADARDADKATKAVERHEPGSCSPPCRSGFFCRKGRCVSLCNPPCPPGERCVRGECEPIPRRGEPTRYNYFALFGGYRAGLSNVAESVGDIRVEIAGRYVGFQMGPSFGTNVTALRAAIMGHVPLKIFRKLPLFILPTLALGYTYNWVDDGHETRQQNLFVTPGARVRYDVLPRMSLIADLIQIELTYLRFKKAAIEESWTRVKSVPVQWGLHFGVALLY